MSLIPFALSLLFAVAPAASAGPCGPAEGPSPAGLAILQGPTDGTSARLAVLARQREPVTLWLLRDGEPPREARLDERAFPGSPWRVLRAAFTDLAPGREYRLIACDGTGRLVDRRTVATLEPTKTSVRFAVASCMDDSYAAEQKGMWDDLASHRPEVLFLIGDNTYADHGKATRGVKTTPESLWRRHAETRLALQLFRQPRLVPIFSTWDDHDYGANDGDATYAHRARSLEIYDVFFPRESPGPGRASSFTAFGQRFFLLDDRYFRTKETHFGVEQEAWLSAALSASAEPAWLMNGDQYFGGYHRFESFEGDHPTAFTAFLTLLRAAKAPVFLVSGDRHLAELMEIGEKDAKSVGYRTYELTTSAIHAKTFPNAWAKEKNPRQVAGVSGVLNYAIVESGVTSGGLDATIAAYGPAKRELFRRTVRVAKK